MAILKKNHLANMMHSRAPSTCSLHAAVLISRNTTRPAVHAGN